ncbi:hypothetical protein [Streptomyces triculaminicus]|uniref:hypothetical protein n=1 Tax=Streptomyces triculaminicus TaxID=2816232 RepID=UPI003792B987
MSPRPCYWHEETQGAGRYLIPGCAARAHDPDAQCTCPLAEHHVADLRNQLDDIRREFRRFRRWHDCVMDAIRAHPDATAIYATAEKAHRP